MMNSKAIVITGTPGNGKSTLARYLSKQLHLHRLDLHRHYKQLAVAYNSQKQCYDLNYRKVTALVRQELKKHPEGIVIDSHIGHLLPKSLVGGCIVLTCSNLKVLAQRLRNRKYNKKKIEENMLADIFQVCLLEAQRRKHKILVYDSLQKKKYYLVAKEVQAAFQRT